MPSIKNNYMFQLAGNLPASGTSVKISNDLERDQTVVFTDGYIVLRSGNKIERAKGTASGGVLTFSKRGLDQSDEDVEVTSLKGDWKEGTNCYITILAVQLQDVLDTVNSGALLPPSYVDDTARNTAISSPVNGMIVYNETDGFLNKYIGGSWVDDTGGAVVANASTTVAGKGQVGTDTQFTNGTLVGSTGATLWATLAQLAKSISLKPLVTVVTPSIDKIAVAYSTGEDKSILISDFVNQVPATTSTKGFGKILTDGESKTGSTSGMVSGDQLKNWSGYTFVSNGNNTESVIAQSLSPVSHNTGAYTEKKAITDPGIGGVVDISFNYGSVFGGFVGYQVRINGSTTAFSGNTSSTSVNVVVPQLTVSPGDRISVYIATITGSQVSLQDFRIRGAIKPVSATFTVNL